MTGDEKASVYVSCDRCGNEWQLSTVDIVNGEIKNKPGYQLQAIKCPNCAALSPIVILDDKALNMQDTMIARANDIRRAIRRGRELVLPSLRRSYAYRRKRLIDYCDSLKSKFADGTFYLLNSSDVIFTADGADLEKEK